MNESSAVERIKHNVKLRIREKYPKARFVFEERVDTPGETLLIGVDIDGRRLYTVLDDEQLTDVDFAINLACERINYLIDREKQALPLHMENS